MILTEYKQSKNRNNDFEKKLGENYHFATDNDVLIALNKKIWNEIEICRFIHRENSPNICVVESTLKESKTKIMIIGMRICVPSKSLKNRREQNEDYINRYNQLMQLKEIEFTTPVILAGDFNNSRYFGDMNELNLKDGDVYGGLSTQYYNLQKIKSFFYSLGFEYYKSTPIGDVTSVYSFKMRFPYKLDHIFVKDMIVESNYYLEDSFKSDHRMLISEVRV